MDTLFEIRKFFNVTLDDLLLKDMSKEEDNINILSNTGLFDVPGTEEYKKAAEKRTPHEQEIREIQFAIMENSLRLSNALAANAETMKKNAENMEKMVDLLPKKE